MRQANIVYKYQCMCGYTGNKTDKLKMTGAYIRLMIDPAISCPQCHRLLQASVTIEYAQSQESALAEIAAISQELGLYD